MTRRRCFTRSNALIERDVELALDCAVAGQTNFSRLAADPIRKSLPIKSLATTEPLLPWSNGAEKTAPAEKLKRHIECQRDQTTVAQTPGFAGIFLRMVTSSESWWRAQIGVPNGIRTRVTNVKGWCPRPLDDGDVLTRGARKLTRANCGVKGG